MAWKLSDADADAGLQLSLESATDMELAIISSSASPLGGGRASPLGGGRAAPLDANVIPIILSHWGNLE